MSDVIVEEFELYVEDHLFLGTKFSSQELGVVIYEGQFQYGGLPFGNLVRFVVDAIMETSPHSVFLNHLRSRLVEELSALAFEGDVF